MDYKLIKQIIEEAASNERTPIISNKWEYEIIKNSEYGLKGYGYILRVFKNDKLVLDRSGYGSVGVAEASAKDLFLSDEFGVEREIE